MFKLRYLLFGLFALLLLLPLVLFGAWSHFQVVRSEFGEVRERHLVLARNLGAALERYHSDVSAAFSLVAANLARSGEIIGAEALLADLHLRHVCVADAPTGAVLAGVAAAGESCPAQVQPGHMERLKMLGEGDNPVFLPVAAGPAGAPTIAILRMVDGKLAVGALRTDYFIALAEGVSLGAKGHAAIVDQDGNVLAHPDPSWVAERRNIAEIPAVTKMMKGSAGIEKFFSPALNDDLVAAYTAIDGPGWGIMIPQPLREFYARAEDVQMSALVLFGTCLLAVLIFTMAGASRLSRPIEQAIAVARDSERASAPSELEVKPSWLVPRELRDMQASFNDMTRKVRGHMAEIRYLAYVDQVTGLPNREAFRILAETEIRRMRKTRASGSLLFIDIDDFKAVNDTLGHETGDDLLKSICAQLADAVHAATGRHARSWPHSIGEPEIAADGSPIIGRDGGDEFVIFVPGIGDADQLLDVLAAVKSRLIIPLRAGDEELNISVSIGAASFPKDGDSFAVLRKRADIAMHHAKRSGKNNFQIYGAATGDVTIAELRRGVSEGLKKGEFVLFYQPKVNARMSRVEGVEALIRWDHPTRGMLPPNSFVPATENSDVVTELGEWVLREATENIKELRRSGIFAPVSVNISARQFCAPGFVETMEAIIEESGVEPSALEIEITEEAVVSNLRATQYTISALQEMGVRIALDDFGRGYSNFSRIADLKVDTLKIDGPLTKRVIDEERVQIIIKSAVEMARGLGCDTVAEGVETPEQAERLADLGCSCLQGFAFARPMSASALIGWIKSFERSGLGDSQALDTRIKMVS